MGESHQENERADPPVTISAPASSKRPFRPRRGAARKGTSSGTRFLLLPRRLATECEYKRRHQRADSKSDDKRGGYPPHGKALPSGDENDAWTGRVFRNAP